MMLRGPSQGPMNSYCGCAIALLLLQAASVSCLQFKNLALRGVLLAGCAHNRAYTCRRWLHLHIRERLRCSAANQILDVARINLLYIAQPRLQVRRLHVTIW